MFYQCPFISSFWGNGGIAPGYIQVIWGGVVRGPWVCKCSKLGQLLSRQVPYTHTILSLQPNWQKGDMQCPRSNTEPYTGKECALSHESRAHLVVPLLQWIWAYNLTEPKFLWHNAWIKIHRRRSYLSGTLLQGEIQVIFTPNYTVKWVSQGI